MKLALNLTNGQPRHRVELWTSRWVSMSLTADQARAAGHLLIELAGELDSLECNKRVAHNHDEIEV